MLLPAEIRSIRLDEPVERTNTLEALAGVVNGFVRAVGLIFKMAYRFRKLLPGNGTEFGGEGFRRP